MESSKEDFLNQQLIKSARQLRWLGWVSCGFLIALTGAAFYISLPIFFGNIFLLALLVRSLILHHGTFQSIQLWHKYQPQRQRNIAKQIEITVSQRMSQIKTMARSALKSAAKSHQNYQAAKLATLHKSEFLATMSHEIRTPMNGVLGITELLRHTELTAQQQQYLDTICSSGTTLLTIIDDLLDYSKLEAGKLAIEHIGFDIHRLIDQCGDMFALLSSQKKLPLIIIAPATLPETLYGDPTRLRQIIVNLLGNAFKFTQQGAIHLIISIGLTH